MKALAEQISELDGPEIYGRVAAVRGLLVEAAGPVHAMPVGARVIIETAPGRFVPCEVVGFADDNALLMPFGALEGVRRGCRAIVSQAPAAVRPSFGWLGRVINALGDPVDGKGPLPAGPSPYPFRETPPPAHARKRVGAPSILGCGRSTLSRPFAGGSEWAFSRARGSANRCFYRCSPATRIPT